ncbi:hypothetical protein P378_19640 [Desulforamulus profundi]|uniref:Uncharacterized protein n=1 Tax=Desulforamulus profundi TaxID=1383067 RepID=A0A2C6MC79_9FIRM|nr:hypothetical protein P378_19640 [Desulforamulus profundi]
MTERTEQKVVIGDLEAAARFLANRTKILT